MADISNILKGFMQQSVKVVSRAASNAVSATRYKMDELGNSGRRREKISELGEKVYELAQAGVALPAELNALLGELKELDQELEVIRSDRAAEKTAAAERAAADKAARAAEKAAAKAAAAAEKATAMNAELAEPVEVEVEAVDNAAPVLDVEPEADNDPVYTGVKPEMGAVPTLDVEAEDEQA